ncbi:MAG TPA: AtzH-like domain-containing protein [Lacunisphaera sp.]
MPTVNDPAVLAEIAALHDAYEQALAANDVATLTRFFWDSPEVTRYGVVEHLYGAEEINAYRRTNDVVITDRKLLRRKIVTFDANCAVVMCEISQSARGKPGHCRQSQTWVRFPETGWRIVAAHVSLALAAPENVWTAYADRTAAALALPLAPNHRPGVIQNLERAAVIAAPLLAHPLPAGIEPAPVFTA